MEVGREVLNSKNRQTSQNNPRSGKIRLNKKISVDPVFGGTISFQAYFSFILSANVEPIPLTSTKSSSEALAKAPSESYPASIRD